MAVPTELTEYTDALAGELQRVLAGALVGSYLHGSGAMGSWDSERSDIDVLAVSSRTLLRPEKSELGARLQSLAAPGAGLEFSLVAHGAISPIEVAPPFELHVTTGTGAKVIDGAGNGGDTDLVMHFAVCRERGVIIRGLPPEATLPAVPRPMLLTTLADELEWGLRNALLHYAILNACRAEAFAIDGKLLSKLEGAEWSRRHGGDINLISGAVAAQQGEVILIEPVEAQLFVAQSRAKVLAVLAEL